VLNASRRFRYTLDLKKEEQKEEVKRKIRAQAHVIRAAYRFKAAAQVNVQPKETTDSVPHVDGALGFGIKEEELTALSRDHNFSALQQYGGISGVANMLKTDTEKGISGDEPDLKARQNAFGSNTYPRKKGRSFLVCRWFSY
jgi:Ca2+-transporting ATPase